MTDRLHDHGRCTEMNHEENVVDLCPTKYGVVPSPRQLMVTRVIYTREVSDSILSRFHFQKIYAKF